MVVGGCGYSLYVFDFMYFVSYQTQKFLIIYNWRFHGRKKKVECCNHRQKFGEIGIEKKGMMMVFI